MRLALLLVIIFVAAVVSTLTVVARVPAGAPPPQPPPEQVVRISPAPATPATPAANTTVTLRQEKISIQTAAMKLCEQAGLHYDWQRSHSNTEPQCRRYVAVDVAGAPITQALDAVVVANGLSYRISGKTVWLER